MTRVVSFTLVNVYETTDEKMGFQNYAKKKFKYKKKKQKHNKQADKPKQNKTKIYKRANEEYITHAQ